MEYLKVVYKSKDRINRKFDDKIRKLAGEENLKFYASGYDFIRQARDLNFEARKESK